VLEEQSSWLLLDAIPVGGVSVVQPFPNVRNKKPIAKVSTDVVVMVVTVISIGGNATAL